MGVYKAAMERRTIRRFQDKPVPYNILEKCVDAARLSPTARNKQPLEFIAVKEPNQVEKMRETIFLGGTVGKKGNTPGEEPKAYIVIIADREKSDEEYVKMDTGIAAQSIALTAFEENLGTCMIGLLKRDKIKELLGIPDDFEIMLAIGLGYPKEEPKAEKPTEDMRYWTDEQGQLHIPKRSLEQVMHKNRLLEKE